MQGDGIHSTSELAAQLESYRLALKRLDECQEALYELGFITYSDQRKIQNFVDDEKARVHRALRSFGLAPDASPALQPTGIPALDAARRTHEKNQ